MRADGMLLALHAGGASLALIAALAWPRAGEAALLVPLGDGGTAQVLRWADREATEGVTIDPASGRVVARVSSHASLMRALAAGIIPIATRSTGCTTGEKP
jgi:hypothetical protein